MSSHVDAGTQTVWAGLMQQSVRPETLFAAPKNTSTPPAEMVTEKEQFAAVVPDITHSHHGGQNTEKTPTLIERRQGRPGLVARISAPNSELNDEDPMSPPPTRALLSPLPEANTRHAGHTPLLPRARSPAQEPEPTSLVPAARGVGEGIHQAALEEDPGLTGSLVLPSKPTDPLESHHFSLDALDHELGRIERQQKILRGEFSDDDDVPEPAPQHEVQQKPEQQQALASKSEAELQQQPGLSQESRETQIEPGPPLSEAALSQHLSSLRSPQAQSTENEVPLGRMESAESRKSGVTEEVDGVILKTPPSNFGAPLGQL